MSEWFHHPEDDDRWESWQLLVYPEQDGNSRRYLTIFIDRDEDPDHWKVKQSGKLYGKLPKDMPREELFATAIAMWRLG